MIGSLEANDRQFRCALRSWRVQLCTPWKSSTQFFENFSRVSSEATRLLVSAKSRLEKKPPMYDWLPNSRVTRTTPSTARVLYGPALNLCPGLRSSMTRVASVHLSDFPAIQVPNWVSSRLRGHKKVP